MDNNKELICEKCSGRNFGSFVNYGSWFLRCLNCKTHGPATSFLAISETLTGDYEAIEVDKDLHPIERIFKGDIKKGIEKIKTQAQEGKIIQLKRVA